MALLGLVDHFITKTTQENNYTGEGNNVGNHLFVFFNFLVT